MYLRLPHQRQEFLVLSGSSIVLPPLLQAVLTAVAGTLPLQLLFYLVPPSLLSQPQPLSLPQPGQLLPTPGSVDQSRQSLAWVQSRGFPQLVWNLAMV